MHLVSLSESYENLTYYIAEEETTLEKVAAIKITHRLLRDKTRESNMSDFEDEMDIDAPPVSNDIKFSSDNTAKGKRSAANLPVEAEDSLPW